MKKQVTITVPARIITNSIRALRTKAINQERKISRTYDENLRRMLEVQVESYRSDADVLEVALRQGEADKI